MKRLMSKMSAAVRRNLLLRKSVILSWHVVGICLTYYLAFLLRFDGNIPENFMRAFAVTLLPLIIVNIAAFALFRLYSGIWAYFSIYDVLRILGALAVSFVLFVPAVFFAMGRTFAGYPRSTPIIGFILLTAWMIGGRFVIRWIRECRTGRTAPAESRDQRALIVGNLADADHLVHSIPAQTPGIGRFVAIVTNEKERHNLTMRGIAVRGFVGDVGTVARETGADSLLILPPYTKPKEMNRIVASCEEAGAACAFRMIPSITDLAAGRIELSTIRNVEIEDLLGRPEVKFDREAVKEMIVGKTVMITGAGGSIGTELAAQISRYSPHALVLFDISEYNLYAVDAELRTAMPDLYLVSVAGDTGNEELVRKVLEEQRVEVIFHAAAYKHVPIMEYNVASCVANNTIATARLAAQAEETGIKRFVLVSTDKAVRPTSVMGASKRLAERIVQERPKSETTFVTVRFGNVLASSGSVIPLFRRQIREGGPVTVTTEKATRFFMSIPEAVDLLLQASVVARDREIMVLEMGESVRVVDMAKHLIKLSGLSVGEDIEIVFTGLRPGEKEYEEVMTDEENVVRTQFEKIWVMQSKGNHVAPPIDLDRLNRLITAQNETRLRQELLRLVPEADSSITIPPPQEVDT